MGDVEILVQKMLRSLYGNAGNSIQEMLGFSYKNAGILVWELLGSWYGRCLELVTRDAKILLLEMLGNLSRCWDFGMGTVLGDRDVRILVCQLFGNLV